MYLNEIFIYMNNHITLIYIIVCNVEILLEHSLENFTLL